ncbi:hypothetical protein [Telmatospirillum sp. J64-1]|uniref:hypothetical protein n=1 Tax=Telmatospirillum sp. J64-1 TaxID=2502183 RepID=UPI00115F1E4C|nr:hypothetical protein [Telmatospirillum sp. J64-1]
MAFKKTHAAVMSAVLFAGGCSFAEDVLRPRPGDDLTGRPAVEVVPSQVASSNGATISEMASTGTFVGQKVSSLRNDLQQLQETLARHNQQLVDIRNQTTEDSQRYHGTVAAVNARLQVGTTPGNPILVQQWNVAQSELDQINADVLQMNQLANEVTSSSALAAYLLESVRAARALSGAVEEDHRQLRVLEDETNRTIVMIERLLTELSQDISRQQQYVANERNNLNTLAVAIKNGQLYGTSLALSAASAAAGSEAAAQQFGQAGTSDRPLVVIRFDQPNVNYETPLYNAVKSALDRRPSTVFDVVAVAPTAGTPGGAALSTTAARRNAEAVVRSLNNMGLPSNRIRLSAITSSGAQSGEVHIFAR